MHLPRSEKHTEGRWEYGHHPQNASLDRLDQTKGYIKGNVRFVALIVNYARHSWTDNDVVTFARAVVAVATANGEGDGLQSVGTQPVDGPA